MSARPTNAQRYAITELFRELEWDHKTITFMHTRIGVSRSWVGRPVDEWLDSLTNYDARVVISNLHELT